MAHRFFDGNRETGRAETTLDASGRDAMSQMPKVNEHHLRIQRLAGTWVGEEKMHASPWGPGGIRHGRYEYETICDGFFVAGDYWQMMHGTDDITYTGHGVFGVDPATQEVTWYWVDSMGYPPPSPSRGRWDGDTLALVGRDAKGQIHGRYTFVFEGNDRLRFKLENTQDGGQTWHTFMEASYLKTTRKA
jgi:Protein of unknown function (DUF1579)